MTRPQILSDAELLAGCKRQERQLQRLFFERFAGKMMVICRRYAHDRMEAEDMLQIGFIRVFDHLDQFQGGSLEGWIKKIFVSVCINQWRKSKKELQIQSTPDEDIKLDEENGLDKLQASELLNLIDGLPHGAKIIFNLFAIEGYQHNEIAEMLGLTEGACRAQVTRARKILQDQLKQLS